MPAGPSVLSIHRHLLVLTWNLISLWLKSVKEESDALKINLLFIFRLIS